MSGIRTSLAAAAFAVAAFTGRADEPVDLFVGTAGLGHVSPAACAPFGAVQAGPDTSASPGKYVGDWAHTSGYQHGDGWLWRFSQTRLSGTGCPGGGDFGILPFAGDAPRAVRMRKETETARPGFYAVDLADGISCSVAASPHGAVYRFAYPKGASAKLLADLDWTIARRGKDDGSLWGVFATYVKESEIRALSPTRLVARRKVRAWVDYEIFCAFDFSRPVVSRTGGVCDFGVLPDGVLEVRLALSATSAEAAAANLDAELKGVPFETVAARTEAAWDAYLSRVRLAPGTDPAVRASFYAALYRTAIQPNDIGDVGREEYSTFSLWDTFRAAHPLYTLLAPERVDGFVRSLLDVYKRNGYLPIWGLRGTDNHCMIGHHAVPVIADAYLKGFRGYDVDLAWRAVHDSLTREHKAVSDSTWGLLKEDWPLLERYGYLPYDALTGGSRGHKVVGESVSRLFEGAYDDACAARFASALGKADESAFFARRSGFWRNALDPATKFARGRNAAGGWREPFDPKACGHCWFQPNDFTEGNAMQYTWHVLHDPDGLVAALGGRDAALAQLQRLFSGESVAYGENGVSDVTGLIGQYAHGNEPSHHVIYFFSLLGRPDLAAKYVKEVFDTQYRPTPDGLCGNDDCGQMSAWYVFSALGFYPFDPCGGEYVVGAPQVPGAELSLPGGKTLTIRTENFTPGGTVAEVVLNGKTVPDFKLRHADLAKGGTLVYRMKRADDAAKTAFFSAAKPVWAEGRADGKNVFLGFRGDFAAREGQKAVLRIAASSLYRVFLNGTFVGYGPARGPNGSYRVDEWELPVRAGTNAVAVEALNYNVPNFYIPKDAGFLQAEVRVDGACALATGTPDGFAARILPKVQRCSRFSYQRGFAEAYALVPDFADWRTNAPAEAVALARTAARPLLPRLAPPPRLDVRPLSFVGATEARYDAARTVPPQRHVTWDGWNAARDAFPPDELEIDVHDVIARVEVTRTQPFAGREIRIGDGKGGLLDGGFNDTGFLGLTVDCRRPGRLIVTFDEVLTNGKVDPQRIGADFGFVYDLKEPGVYRLENFEPNTFRYVHLFMQDGLAEVSAPYVRACKNAAAYRARFESADPQLNAVFDAARETFAQNAVDVFTDCPSRERAGWLCDSFFIGRVSRLLTGSLALEDLFLDNYARAASFDVADGMLPMCYPGDHVNGNYIPNWAMWLVLELDEYVRRGGDARLVAAFRPRLEKLVAFLWKYRNADGLLEKLPGWVFVEWSQANKWVQDVNYPSNMLWAETLDAVDRLYGRPDLAAEAARVRETVRRQSWDGRWFRDHAVRQADGSLAVRPDDISETCQYYAFFFKVATPETHPALWRTLVESFGPSRLDAEKKPLAYPQVAPSNAFIGNYLRLECLSRAGLSGKVLEECRGYFAAMAARTGTLWEFDKPTHSCCHGFASHAAVLLVRDVLGVKKIDYAARTVVFEPPAESPLAFCEAALPVEDGKLELGWRRSGDGAVEKTVRLPGGWRLSAKDISKGTKR